MTTNADQPQPPGCWSWTRSYATAYCSSRGLCCVLSRMRSAGSKQQQTIRGDRNVHKQRRIWHRQVSNRAQPDVAVACNDHHRREQQEHLKPSRSDANGTVTCPMKSSSVSTSSSNTLMCTIASSAQHQCMHPPTQPHRPGTATSNSTVSSHTGLNPLLSIVRVRACTTNHTQPTIARNHTRLQSIGTPNTSTAT